MTTANPDGRSVVALDPDDAIDLAEVDEIVACYGREPQAVVAVLQAIQRRFGYLPPRALRRVCETSDITPARITGVSTFYRQFRHRPVGRHRVRVCHGTACHVAGAVDITESIRRHLHIEGDEDTDAKRVFTVEKVACLGCCSLAPCLQIDGITYGRLTPQSAPRAVERFRKEYVS